MVATDTSARIAILFKDRLHPAHAGLADAIGADRIRFPGIDNEVLTGSVLEDVQGVLRRLRSFPTDYDVYVSEDAIGLYAAPVFARRTDATHVYLAANHRTYGRESYDAGSPWNPFAVTQRVDRAIDVAALGSSLRRYVDGVLAVSALMADNVSRIAPGTPVRIAHPYVEPGLYDRLGDVEPTLDHDHAVFVGKNRPHKGVDALVRAWPRIRERHPEATLELVGKGHERHDQPGVQATGFVDDVADAYGRASLCVQPARIDPFPVTVLEAIRAGLPPAATTTCGVSPYLASVDPTLRCEPTIDGLVEAVSAYFDRSLAERRSLSGRIRQLTGAFEPDRSKRAFAEQFCRLLGDLDVTEPGRHAPCAGPGELPRRH